MNFFSKSDVPSMCLRDIPRTRAFRDAILRLVRPGATVLDAGAGSGVLSFFAAQAGASKVYAVEMDTALAEHLRENSKRNGFGHIIEVIQADVRELRLPGAVDVVIAEMIETWLLDELQVPALNALRDNGVIGATTRIIPERYTGFAEVGTFDFSAHGFQFRFPVHDWRYLYLQETDDYLPTHFQPLTDKTPVFAADFTDYVEPRLDARVSFNPISGESTVANAVRLTGVAQLTDGITLDATVAFNGHKILPIQEIILPGMGGGKCFRFFGAHGGAGGLGALRVAHA